MLTIGQLAAHAGCTTRAVRHYHAIGLLSEPDKDHSGYRRYDAGAVVELVKIRVLAEAGVPLGRVHELLRADTQAFEAAVDEIERRLAAEVAERQRQRRAIARLASGERLVLPPEVVDYLERVRELGLSPRVVEVERDSWILVAARAPEAVGTMMAVKRRQIEDPVVQQLYRDLEDLFTCGPDDPRLPTYADMVVRFIVELGRTAEEAVADTPVDDTWLTDDLVQLLDDAFVAAFPAAARLLELLEERGYTGWTNIRPIDEGSGRPA
ncbi:MerR family transcriptional regulator [Nocardioides marmoraquaticus]